MNALLRRLYWIVNSAAWRYDPRGATVGRWDEHKGWLWRLSDELHRLAYPHRGIRR